MPSPQKQLRYNLKKTKTEIDGISFMSKLEARFYEYMKTEPRIRILELQPRYELQPKYVTKDGRKIRGIEYVADFLIDVEGDVYVVDAKGQETPDFKLKRKIFEYRRPDEKLLVVKSLKELRLAIF